MNNPPQNAPTSALISVIMPCYNAAPYLEEAVNSVMNQSYRNVELIVIDDGSTDDSVPMLERMAQRHPGRIKLFFQQRQGPYPARNLGLAKAMGEFIAFLDADDWWNPRCLAELYGALQHSDAALAYCGWQNIGATDRSSEPHVPPDYEQGDKVEQFLRAAAPWPIHAALVRRRALEEAGGFDVSWPSCMDYDLWLRIAVTHPIVRVPKVMAFYRHHVSGQITSTQWRQARNTWLVKRKFIHNHPGVVNRLGKRKIRELVDEALLRRGYDTFWRRDITSAQRIFRMALTTRAWKAKDLRYLLPALLPENIYRWLVARRD